MHAALLKATVFFNNKLHSHNAKARKDQDVPGLETPSIAGHVWR